MTEVETAEPALPGPSALDRLLLNRRLSAFRIGSVLAYLPSLFAILLLAVTFYDDVPTAVMLPWATLCCSLIALRAVLGGRISAASGEHDEERRLWRSTNVLLMTGSSAYAAIFPVIAVYASGQALAVLALIAMSVFVGVLLMHRTAPAAALYHIVVIAISMAASALLIAGAASWPALAVIAVNTVTLLAATRVQERNLVRSVRAEVEREEAADTVRLLLNEYEEQSSDWLWTVGPRGNLRDVSPRLAEALANAPETLEGSPFLALFQRGEDKDQLARHIVERSAFRDLLLRLRIDGDLRYWRLSARPRSDGRLSGVARDVTNDKLIEDRVAFMAHFDNLTGLANRYLFNERLRALLSNPQRAGNVALFYLDLDDFKAINDTRGHIVGDRLLREVGTRLEQEVRGEDLVARLGGDEFAVLIETKAGAGMLIERAHRFLSVVRDPYEIEGQLYRVSTSVGVARCSEGDCSAEELMRRADLALFAAKGKGRDNLALFEPSLDKAARERREIETDLREAIPRGELRLHYQPVIDLDTAVTRGYEALLRWHHPRRGIMAPGEFLQVAEETGLIVPIGEWVIRQALNETAPWPGDFRIAINLSPTQVKNPHLVTVVAQAINATGYDPERVELEITEHVLMQAGGASYTTLLKLREMGTKIALDDFGIGYSSLSYLRRFPFDRIKIDRHFVEDIEDSTDNQAIVSSITRLADALGMQTTAEGIERRKQLDLLRKLGCQEAQGFLICEPLPSEQLPTVAGIDPAQVEYGSEVVDYRKAREAAIRRKGGRAA